MTTPREPTPQMIEMAKLMKEGKEFYLDDDDNIVIIGEEGKTKKVTLGKAQDND